MHKLYEHKLRVLLVEKISLLRVKKIYVWLFVLLFMKKKIFFSYKKNNFQVN